MQNRSERGGDLSVPQFQTYSAYKKRKNYNSTHYFLKYFAQWASLPLLHQGFLHLHHNGAFHSLSEKLTAILIGTGNISGGVVGICGTTSGAI